MPSKPTGEAGLLGGALRRAQGLSARWVRELPASRACLPLGPPCRVVRTESPPRWPATWTWPSTRWTSRNARCTWRAVSAGGPGRRLRLGDLAVGRQGARAGWALPVPLAWLGGRECRGRASREPEPGREQEWVPRSRAWSPGRHGPARLGRLGMGTCTRPAPQAPPAARPPRPPWSWRPMWAPLGGQGLRLRAGWGGGLGLGSAAHVAPHRRLLGRGHRVLLVGEPGADPRAGQAAARPVHHHQLPLHHRADELQVG